jgi:outer membrane protein OmpA-like peptidoglycan-associated protein
LIWDGKASDGELVISAEDYPYEFVIGDELGNVNRVQGTIPVDILVIRDGDRLRVQIANINFAPNSPSLVLDPDSELGARNIAIIERLGEVFEKYSTYNIRIEGHAVNVTGTEQEEREQLQPLSLQRAETVRQALIEQGIAGRRVTTLGMGGTEPVVPHTDLENRWKNRRVEFILIR